MNRKILYIYPWEAAFIDKDLDFLSRRYSVVTLGHDWRDKRRTLPNFMKQFIFLCRNMAGTRAIIVMFGGYWSFLPALAGKLAGVPVFIIPGGTDCVSFPSLNYGSLRKPVMRTFIRWSYQLCTKLLPVDESLVLSDYTYLPDIDYPKQGFMYFFPGLRTPHRVIHNGFDPAFFTADPAGKKENSFIAVAHAQEMLRVRIKGIDLVILLAKRFTNCNFTLVGVSDSLKRELSPLPSNLAVYPWMSKEKFIGHLAESRFVLQLSVSEGFPNALCEAMLCHCIPVGSPVGAIPSIIANTGFVIASPEWEYLEKRFEEILHTGAEEQHRLGIMARNRVADMYHISRREKAFLEILDEIPG